MRRDSGGGPLAHVDYVVDGADAVDALRFLADVVGDPANAAPLAAGVGGVVAAAAAYLRYQPAAADVRALRGALAEYDDYLPWMLRLSVGLPLVGAGFAGYYFSPAVPADARLLQVALGFLLLFGLATRVVAAVALVAYFAGLAVHPELLLAGEYVGGLAGVVLLGSGRPSADHLLQRVADADGVYGEFDPVAGVSRWFNRRVEPYATYAPTAVRLPLGGTFAYLGVVEKLANPGAALAVVEKYGLAAVVPVDPGLWVVGAGLVELAVGTALVLGLFTRGTAAVAFVTLTLTLFALPDDPVLAHVTLFGLTSAVFVTGGGPLSVDAWLHRAGAAARGGVAAGE